MGSSAKKKREKKKDFQKPKLKVGKARPKAANQTDTSFRSKAIVLNQQSLNVVAPSAANQFNHNVSLLTAKSDTQRKDSLAYLTTFIHSKVVDSPLPQPTSTLLNRLCPLILDGSGSVRAQMLKLLKALPIEEVQDHAFDILPYIRAGMTHLAPEIRASAVDVLSWLLEVAGEDVVSCAGGWVKTLNCFVTTLGWQVYDSGKWSSNRATFGKPGVDGKAMSRNLHVLAEFLRAGISTADQSHTLGNEISETAAFPMWHTEQHMIPAKSNVYDYLNLYGAPRDDDNQMVEDREDRLRLFDEQFRLSVTTGLEICKKEGGEIGRAAALVTKLKVSGSEGQRAMQAHRGHHLNEFPKPHENVGYTVARTQAQRPPESTFTHKFKVGEIFERRYSNVTAVRGQTVESDDRWLCKDDMQQEVSQPIVVRWVKLLHQNYWQKCYLV